MVLRLGKATLCGLALAALVAGCGSGKHASRTGSASEPTRGFAAAGAVTEGTFAGGTQELLVSSDDKGLFVLRFACNGAGTFLRPTLSGGVPYIDENNKFNLRGGTWTRHEYGQGNMSGTFSADGEAVRVTAPDAPAECRTIVGAVLYKR
jgi:hypothetical protein